jgi:hypothetical protein
MSCRRRHDRPLRMRNAHRSCSMRERSRHTPHARPCAGAPCVDPSCRRRVPIRGEVLAPSRCRMGALGSLRCTPEQISVATCRMTASPRRRSARRAAEGANGEWRVASREVGKSRLARSRLRVEYPSPAQRGEGEEAPSSSRESHPPLIPAQAGIQSHSLHSLPQRLAPGVRRDARTRRPAAAYFGSRCAGSKCLRNPAQQSA